MKIELPQVGESVTEGVIGRWLKQVGDRVDKYDPLVEVVTDKVDMEVPSPASGVLTGILVEEGQTVPMGAAIAELQVEGVEEASSVGDAAEAEAIDRTGVLLTDVAPVGPTGSGGPAAPVEKRASGPPKRSRYSPAVQRLADEHDVDLSAVAGTGIGGRLTRRDVQSYIASVQGKAEVTATQAQAGLDEERVPLTPIRRIIADNMVKSATQIPQAWSMVEADVTGLVQLRESAKEEFQRTEGVNLTYLPFVLEAVAQSLKENPLLNSSWGDDAIVVKRRINIGIAVAAPAGLLVPVIKDADTLSVVELARAIDDLTTRVRQGKHKLEDVQGGTFTVNNTGALGSVVSQPLVNYPQAAILATEAIVKRPAVVNDAIAVRSVMNLCLTFDHRVLDGAQAGAFLASVKGRLEAIGPDTSIN